MGHGEPAGQRAFLFTDIEGSTRLWERFPEDMPTALALHDDLLRKAVVAHHGRIFKSIGDAICAVFPDPVSAALAAIDAQRSLAATNWSERGVSDPLTVRMAVHAGPVQELADDFSGPVLNRISRLLAAGHGGQILLAGDVAARLTEALPAGVELRDLGDRRLRDVSGTEHIFQVVIDGISSTFPPLNTLETVAHNLPTTPTPCIGREAERVRLRAVFPRSEVRLVTLLGPGGIGKTRLALQAAADLLDEFHDGVWFIDLTAVRDDGLVAGAAIRGLGLREEPGQDTEDSLMSWLSGKSLLLVLDNCEQVVDGAARIAANVLRNAPNARVLATSRAPLEVRGEQRMPVEPLALPKDEKHPDYQSISETASVQLFVSRAQEARPSFALSAGNAAPVAAICRRVDGIPLALELAAARVTVLSPEALRDRLERLLPTLQSGSRDLPERHQTLHNAILWSYELLSPGEQTVFRRLAVFAGGWTLASAEAVMGDDLETELLRVLESLAAQSLIRAELNDGEETRFSMLETIREFALERLQICGEEAQLRETHAGFYLRLAEEAAPSLLGDEFQQTWMKRFDLEYDNLRAAANWWMASQNADSLLRLCTSIWHYWSLRGFILEGLQWLRQALDIASDTDASLRASALRKLGNLSIDIGDTRTARTLYEESLEIERATMNVEGIADSLSDLGMVAAMQGRYGDYRPLLEESRVLSRRIGSVRGDAIALFNLAIGDRDEGDLDSAEELHYQVLEMQRSLQDRTGQAWSWYYLGRIERDRGQFELAEHKLNQAQQLFTETSDELGLAKVDEVLGTIAVSRGELDEAETIFRKSLSVHRNRADKPSIAEALEGLASIAVARQEVTLAKSLLAEASALRAESEWPVSLQDAPVLQALHRQLSEMSEQLTSPQLAGQCVNNVDVGCIQRTRSGETMPFGD